MNDATTYRLFVAIAIPDAVKAELNRTQRELRALLLPHSASWTRPDNMHLTLRFLGDVETLRLEELQRRLQDAAAGFGSMDLLCERLGCFPDLRSPRVIWAGVQDAAGRLAALARRANEAVAPFAEKPAEARFTGHVTLARPKRLGRDNAERLAQVVAGAAARQFGRWHAGELELIRSELLPGGSRYSTLARFDLNSKASGQ